MALKLQITSKHPELSGEDIEHSFGPDGGTIGRALSNDWVLPDPQRYVSSHHATIDYQSGSYYLIDTSTNGVYVNGSDVPVGAGKPQRVFNGDRLRIGDYVISVALDEGEELDAAAIAHTDSTVFDLVEPETDDERARRDLVDIEEITGSQAFNSALFGEGTTDTVVPEQSERPRAVKPGGAPKRRSAAAAGDSRAGASSAAAGGRELEGADGALLAFFQGLGMSASDLGHPDTNELLRNAGAALRELVQGTMALLQARAAMKNKFRLEPTTIRPRENNALKFSVSADDALRNLLGKRKREFAPPGDSVRAACQDLHAHHDAVLAAMESAFEDFAERLDPEELAQKFESTGKRGGLFGGSAKARYWELYCELYRVMTDRPKGQFPHLFGDDFARAYGEENTRITRTAETKLEDDAA